MVLSEESALQLSAVWACARILTETISTLPIAVYERQGEDRVIARDHTLHYVLTKHPNPRQTAVEFRQSQLLNLVLHGNSYARIERNGIGQVIALWPLSSEQVDVKVLNDGSLVYLRNVDGNIEAIAEKNILHVKLFGNGIVGLSPLGFARVSLGVAASSEQYAGKFYANGAKPGGVLTIDKVLNKDQRAAIRENFKELTEGAENAHKLFVLEAGMKYEQVQISPEDAQMLQTRRFQLEDIARFFGVPSFLINDTEKTTTWGSGIEQMLLGFYTLTLRPYLKLLEDSYNTHLLLPKDQSKFYVEHNFDALMRADSAGRATFYSTMVQNGLMTRNEARRKENLSAVPGGDQLTAQVNLAPLHMLGSRNAAQNPPA